MGRRKAEKKEGEKDWKAEVRMRKVEESRCQVSGVRKKEQGVRRTAHGI